MQHQHELKAVWEPGMHRAGRQTYVQSSHGTAHQTY